MATRVKVKTIMDGPGPGETIIAISVKGGGEEEVILPKSFVQGDNTVEVGRVGGNQDSVLIELPQESATGSWRLWVDPGTLA